MFHFKNRDRELQLKNIFGQMRALSKTANNDELRSMQSWLKYVDDLDLIEKNLRGLRDTMENRIYLDKIEETWIDLERMGWSEWTGRPVNILDAREAMVRDEMNRLVRYATKSERRALRLWCSDRDIDRLERNVARLQRAVQDRHEARGGLRKLLETADFRFKTLFRRMAGTGRGQQPAEQTAKLRPRKGQRGDSASARADLSGTDRDLSWHAEFFSPPKVDLRGGDSDLGTSAESADDDRWSEVDEIYAMNRMPVIYAAPIDAVPETPDFDGFRQQDSDLYDTCLESRDTCSTICSTVIDFEQAVCSTPQKTRVEVFV